MIKKKLCAIPECTYPTGECSGACYHPDERRMDIIGQNGNTAESYGNYYSVELTVFKNSQFEIGYRSHSVGDVRQLMRVRDMLNEMIQADLENERAY